MLGHHDIIEAVAEAVIFLLQFGNKGKVAYPAAVADIANLAEILDPAGVKEVTDVPEITDMANLISRRRHFTGIWRCAYLRTVRAYTVELNFCVSLYF